MAEPEPPREVLAELIAALPRARVLCLGDLILDRFVYGRVARLSPEAPVPVLRIEREDEMLGGAGNVAANLAALGARATLVSLVGDDAAGAAVAALAGAVAGLECHLVTAGARATPEKTRFVADRQQLLRTDGEDTRPIDDASAAALSQSFEAALADADIVVLSDYGKGVLSDTVLGPAIRAARDAGKRIVVDPKREDWRAYAGASLITPNRAELAAATGAPTASDDEVAAAARRVLAETEIEALVVTRSEAGISLLPRDGAAVHLATRAREVYDVAGAGDSVVAALAAGIAAGGTLVEAARLANLAGGVVVGKVGTAVVRRQDLETALLERSIGTSEAKLVGAETAAERVRQWRAQGHEVGFTNGCFDLLHPGHVSLMRQARAACDRLVVGLNSDASVALLKGPGRPLQDEVARAIVLASLADVDLVVVFAEPTPIELIRLLQPDVLVKGADYSRDQVVGADAVESWGGRVLLAELEVGNSTTDTIARARRGGGEGP
ncbi:MAG: D-glycero-beta-D-manno-heptose-7-phosphate kinase [Alphaproteobacteria bacterium]|jgi:D-beta-D-heptose 7-phosphate kinase/D-beta-D-heptose 1-phosphate adenosyltransferase|nr:D-glycero-beta-D-manno-heptose-7-phosphate kinase [Alphaproteobacteria bacterium]